MVVPGSCQAVRLTTKKYCADLVRESRGGHCARVHCQTLRADLVQVCLAGPCAQKWGVGAVREYFFGFLAQAHEAALRASKAALGHKMWSAYAAFLLGGSSQTIF